MSSPSQSSSSSPHLKHRYERYKKTMRFLEKFCPPPLRVMDIGASNALSGIMAEAGYTVTNTDEIRDLDLDHAEISYEGIELVTAFEILEHLLNPFGLLRSIRAKRLIASVPLDLWFAKAYWNESDLYDRHFHEFEPRQFDWLLEKTGWQIVASEKWISKASTFGIRPILRLFTPRYYIVYCERKVQQ